MGLVLVRPLTMYHIGIDVIFVEYHEHLVLEDVRSMLTNSPWSMYTVVSNGIREFPTHI